MNKSLVATACPDQETLRAFESGDVSEADWGRRAEHIYDCHKCQGQLERESSNNHLAKLLRDAVHESCGTLEFARQSPRQVLNAQNSIEGYRLLECIGQGGMGRVFKAEHVRMKRIVAVKLLNAAANASHQPVSRFQREVEAAGKLIHKHVVTAYDAGEHLGRPFLVMEYIVGESLAEMVRRRGPLPVWEAVEFVRQTALALEYAHAQGVVHRDIKPSNILVNREGIVKLLDLGLARIDLTSRPSLADPLTSSGLIMGTAEYMAPEQARDSRAADHLADLYSLGCTLHFLLTGSAPYCGKSQLEILLAHIEKPLPNLRLLRDGVDDDLISIHQRLLAKSPADRFVSATALLAAFDRLSVRTHTAYDEPIPPPIDGSTVNTVAMQTETPTTQFAHSLIGFQPGASQPARRTKSRLDRKAPLFPIAFALLAVFAVTTLLLTVIVVISEEKQSFAIEDIDNGETTIHITSLPQDTETIVKSTAATTDRGTDRTAQPEANLTQATPKLGNPTRSERQPTVARQPPSDNPFVQLSQQINEVRSEIERRKRAGEFGSPADSARMQHAANLSVRRRQLDGRLPADQTIVIHYGPNGLFSFTAQKSASASQNASNQPTTQRKSSSRQQTNNEGKSSIRGLQGGGFGGGGGGVRGGGFGGGGGGVGGGGFGGGGFGGGGGGFGGAAEVGRGDARNQGQR